MSNPSLFYKLSFSTQYNAVLNTIFSLSIKYTSEIILFLFATWLWRHLYLRPHCTASQEKANLSSYWSGVLL